MQNYTTIFKRRLPDMRPAGEVCREMPGQAVLSDFGNYTVLGEIARGGMGVVYEARQKGLRRPVALKMIHPQLVQCDETIQRFRIEAEAMAALHHPNIVPIYEIGEHAGNHYFSMQLVVGQNLAEAIIEKPMEIPEAVRLVIKIARTLQHAHERGVLHRDLKPSNILLDKDGEPRVTDFGIARFRERESHLPHSSNIMGTPGYMSPEQANGDPANISTCTDVYGLGAVLYCLLTGRPPFSSANSLDTLEQIRHDKPAPPSSCNTNVHKDVEFICLKCLEKEPQQRYCSAAALANDLENWLMDRPILARPVTLGERVFRWARRWARRNFKRGVAVAFGVGAFYVSAVVKLATSDKKEQAGSAGSFNQAQIGLGANILTSPWRSPKLDLQFLGAEQPWKEFKGFLNELSAGAASSSLRSYLNAGKDSSTKLTFQIGPDGFLASAPTMRVFLLDYWGKADPQAAGEYAKTIFNRFNSADEWAVSLRNYARADTTPEGRRYLQAKWLDMLRHESWQHDPTVGYLEAFDTAVYLGGTNLVPVLAELIQKQKNMAVCHAAFLALDRLVLDDSKAILELLSANQGWLEGREMSRAHLFARAHVSCAREKAFLEAYLLNPAVRSSELELFAGIYPNANFSASYNLLTSNFFPSGAEIQAQDKAALRVLKQWRRDQRFARLNPYLVAIQGRLKAYTKVSSEQDEPDEPDDE